MIRFYANPGGTGASIDYTYAPPADDVLAIEMCSGVIDR